MGGGDAFVLPPHLDDFARTGQVLTMSQPPLESELIDSAVAGDEHALERLLLKYAGRLRVHVVRRIHSDIRSHVDADDVLQETFFEVFRSIGTFEPKGKHAFYRWLITITEHRLLDIVRARRAAKRGGGRVQVTGVAGAASDSMDQLIELVAGRGDTPSQTVSHQEATIAVQVGLASLKEDYRRAIELRYILGHSLADAAVEMDRTPAAVSHLCSRGLKELHAVMGRTSQYLIRK